MSRSCHCVKRALIAAPPATLHRLLSRLAHSPLAGQGCARAASCPAASLRHDCPRSTRRRLASPLRTSRGLSRFRRRLSFAALARRLGRRAPHGIHRQLNLAFSVPELRVGDLQQALSGLQRVRMEFLIGTVKIGRAGHAAIGYRHPIVRDRSVALAGKLSRMDTHPSESTSVAYLIEREEKLAGARVHALVDRRHARDKESLRWDIIGVLGTAAQFNTRSCPCSPGRTASESSSDQEI